MEKVEVASDLADLLRDLTLLDFSGDQTPSQLVAHGAGAFPVVTGNNSAAVVAAARCGQGRVVHFGHESYVTAGDLQDLQLNCLAWCLGDREKLKDGEVSIGTDTDLDEGHVFHRFKPHNLPRGDLSIDKCQVYLTTSYSADHADRIVDFVTKGGALICGGHAWYWSYSNAQKNALIDYPGNSWLCPLGIGVTSATADISGEVTTSEASGMPGLIAMLTDEATVSARSVDGLQSSGDHVFTQATIGQSAFHPAWEALKSAVAGRVGEAWLKVGLDFSMWLVPVLLHQYAESPAGSLLLKSQLSANFPGDMASAAAAAADDAQNGPLQLTSIQCSVDASYEGLPSGYSAASPDSPVWRCTGAYAPPGYLVILEVPEALIGHGIDMLIGCHTDLVPVGQERPPCIHCAFPIEGRLTRGFNPYGGIVYVRVPPGSSCGMQQISVSGVVPYPVFTLGESEPHEWLRELQETQAPMFELRVPGQLVISAPLSVAKALDGDPEGVARLWQRVMTAINEFHCVHGDPTVPGSSARPREERIVLDKAISAGSMHAGYPIMGYLDYDRCCLSAEKITNEESWGPVHELGHNHQWQGSEFTGTDEASNNVVNVYVHETVFGIPRSRIPNVAKASRKTARRAYLAGGKKFHKTWGVWLALDTFLQLQEAFGWEPFKQLNQRYRNMTNNMLEAEDQEKIDTYVQVFSEIVSRNLVPFFRAWGFPLSKSVDAALAALPPWRDHPMSK